MEVLKAEYSSESANYVLLLYNSSSNYPGRKKNKEDLTLPEEAETAPPGLSQ